MCKRVCDAVQEREGHMHFREITLVRNFIKAHSLLRMGRRGEEEGEGEGGAGVDMVVQAEVEGTE